MTWWIKTIRFLTIWRPCFVLSEPLIPRLFSTKSLTSALTSTYRQLLWRHQLNSLSSCLICGPRTCCRPPLTNKVSHTVILHCISNTYLVAEVRKKNAANMVQKAHAAEKAIAVSVWTTLALNLEIPLISLTLLDLPLHLNKSNIPMDAALPEPLAQLELTLFEMIMNTTSAETMIVSQKSIRMQVRKLTNFFSSMSTWAPSKSMTWDRTALL